MQRNSMIKQRDEKEKILIQDMLDGSFLASEENIDIDGSKDSIIELKGISVPPANIKMNTEKYGNACVIVKKAKDGKTEISTLSHKIIALADIGNDSIPEGRWLGVMELHQPYTNGHLACYCNVSVILGVKNPHESLWKKVKELKEQAYENEKAELASQLKSIYGSSWLDPDKKVLRRRYEKGYTFKADRKASQREA